MRPQDQQASISISVASTAAPGLQGRLLPADLTLGEPRRDWTTLILPQGMAHLSTEAPSQVPRGGSGTFSTEPRVPGAGEEVLGCLGHVGGSGY